MSHALSFRFYFFCLAFGKQIPKLFQYSLLMANWPSEMSTKWTDILFKWTANFNELVLTKLTFSITNYFSCALKRWWYGLKSESNKKNDLFCSNPSRNLKYEKKTILMKSFWNSIEKETFIENCSSLFRLIILIKWIKVDKSNFKLRFGLNVTVFELNVDKMLALLNISYPYRIPHLMTKQWQTNTFFYCYAWCVRSSLFTWEQIYIEKNPSESTRFLQNDIYAR